MDLSRGAARSAGEIRLAIRRERRGSWVWLLTLVVVGALGWGEGLEACNIPVFRYALERWRPDPFEVVVFHEGPLSDEQRAIVEGWRARSIEMLGREELDSEPANFEVVLADRAGKSNRQLDAIWSLLMKGRDEPPALPWVVVRAPGDPRAPHLVRQGPLADDLWTKLLESPVRAELRRRLLSGHSVVWLFVPGRSAESNERVERLLAEKLPELEREISLPEGIGSDGVDFLTEVPLEITFSTLKLARDDVRESPLIELLAAQLPALADVEEPFLLPVFGCGRVLDAIGGKEVDGDVLRDATQFLCGACSCQVKDLNPGVDMLMMGDWDHLLSLAGRPEDPASKRGAGKESDGEPKYVPIPGTPGKGRLASSAEAPSESSAAASAGADANSEAGARGGKTGSEAQDSASRASRRAAISATDSPLPTEAPVELPETAGMSRANRDQSERWPTSVTTVMVAIGFVAVGVAIARRVRRRAAANL